MQDVERHARDLFDRARAGDQNAMKELVRVREDAARGDAVSRKVYDFLLQYGKQHPMGNGSGEIVVSRNTPAAVMSGEERHALGILRAADQNDPRSVMWALHKLPSFGHSETVRAACVALAHQQPLTDSRIGCFEGLLPTEPRRLVFRHAVKVSPSRREIDALRQQIPAELHGETQGTVCAGYCLGTARKFQVARLPKSPVSIMGADIGWECGL